MPDTERPTPEGLCGTHGQAPYTRDGHCICAAIRAAEAPLRERIAVLEQMLAAEKAAREEAEAGWDDSETMRKSLLVELWDGVRAHGLAPPSSGRDGERLIHAYCGGIAKERLRAEAAEARADAAERALGEARERVESGLAGVVAACGRALSGDLDRRSLVATLGLVVKQTQGLREELKR